MSAALGAGLCAWLVCILALVQRKARWLFVSAIVYTVQGKLNGYIAIKWLLYAIKWLLYAIKWLLYAIKWLLYAIKWLLYAIKWLLYAIKWLLYVVYVIPSSYLAIVEVL